MASTEKDKSPTSSPQPASANTNSDACADLDVRAKQVDATGAGAADLNKISPSPIPTVTQQPRHRVGDDIFIQDTNNDAARSKRFAVKLGYWKDPYLELFVRQAPRKPPEINRGYYARVFSIHKLVKEFLHACKTAGVKSQIVSLGAGSDTLYWRLCDEKLQPSTYVEVDFATVTSKKIAVIKKSQQLSQKLTGDIQSTESDLHSTHYHVVASDLREVGKVEAALKSCDVDFTKPTLFLAECVLVYMDACFSHSLLQWITANLSTALFVNYEQVNLNDRFGSIMLQSLEARGCPLRGASVCSSVYTQERRFRDAGWDGVTVVDMNEAYAAIPETERQRIERLEMLDEAELSIQLLQHYCIGVAYKEQKSCALSLERIRLE